MDESEIRNLVAFCVLMQNGAGISSKAPSYLEAKFRACMAGGRPLDVNNQKIFDNWLSDWNQK